MDEGLEWILISGQLGAELWAAEAAYDLQEEYPDLKVAVITPFYEQEKNWKEPNKEQYEAVLAQADYEASLTHRPYESPLQFKQKISSSLISPTGFCFYMTWKRKAPLSICLGQRKKGANRMAIPSTLLQWMT